MKEGSTFESLAVTYPDYLPTMPITILVECVKCQHKFKVNADQKPVSLSQTTKPDEKKVTVTERCPQCKTLNTVTY